MMICKNCGYEITDGNNKFCPNCGTAIDSNIEQGADSPAKKGFKINKSIIIIAVIVLFAVIAGGLFLSNVTVTNELEDALSSKNGDLVYSIYSEAFGNERLLLKYDKVIAETIDEMINDLNSHDFKSEAVEDGDMAVEYYTYKWGTLLANESGADLSACISLENQYVWEELWNLIESKAYYCDGICFYLKYKHYESAISSFSVVIETDSAYEDAQNMIEECVYSYISSTLLIAEDRFDDGDISGGLELLTSARDYLDEYGLNSDEISNKIDATLVEYAASYAAKAEEALKEHDVNAAIGNIEVAIELQPDNGEYKTKYETYQQYLPFELYIRDNVLNIEVVGVDFHFDKSMESNDNKQMDHSIEWEKNTSVYGSSSYTSALNYNLAGRYDSVTGTIFLSKDSKNTGYEAYFTVYGDGKLLYTSPKVTKGVLPQEVAFNVTGVHKLKIEFYGEGAIGFPAYFGVSNLIAQKDFPI